MDGVGVLDEASALAAGFDRVRVELLVRCTEMVATASWHRTGSRTLAEWLATWTPLELPEARRLARLAGLCHRHPVLGDAVRDGGLSFGRAEALARHVTDVREPLLAASLATLLAQSARLVRHDDWCRLLAHWADLVDAELARPPRMLDRAIYLSQGLFGGGQIHGRLDDEGLVVLSAALDAFLPEPDQTGGPVRPRTMAERRADALTDLARFGLTGETDSEADSEGPRRSGVSATVVIDLRTLAGDRSTTDLDGFDLHADRWRLATSAAERLLCDASFSALLLDGRRTILDASDRSDCFTAAQRRALAVRDGGCVFPGCTRSPRFCQAHHLHWRSRGGRDTTANAALVCSHHHRLLHHGWHLEPTEAGWTAIDPIGRRWTPPRAGPAPPPD